VHETALAENILTIAASALAPYRIERVNKLVVKAGFLAQIIPEALEFAFTTLSQGHICQGAELVLEIEPIEAKCQNCVTKYQSRSLPLTCPVCGGNVADIISGDEMYLDKIDFNEE
jgi:hydrogenase nickel incorporation protein HypA/HybF